MKKPLTQKAILRLSDESLAKEIARYEKSVCRARPQVERLFEKWREIAQEIEARRQAINALSQQVGNVRERSGTQVLDDLLQERMFRASRAEKRLRQRRNVRKKAVVRKVAAAKPKKRWKSA